jgi:hypothetical protein
MDMKINPIVGDWYRHLDKGQMFQVVAMDENDALIELQRFDADIEEVDLSFWHGMDLEVIEAPGDWTGPMDNIERDDLGYSETAMLGSDWGGPLQEIPREQLEAWENSRSEEDATAPEEAQPTEEYWEAETIQTDDVASGANERNQ